MKYRSTYPITAAQIDEQYRLTVDGLLTYFENTVARYFTSLGLAAFDLQKDNMTWVITEINLDLPEPLTMWSEDIEITVWISELSTLRVWMDFHAREVHSGKMVAKGNSCWSVISMSVRKAVPCGYMIPDGEMEGDLAIGPHKKRSVVSFGEETVTTLKHTVNRIDLDFNGHMNNRRYVQMALACFGDEFLADRRPDCLGIRFIRESRIGEEVTTRTHQTEDPAVYNCRISNGCGEDLCRVVTHWKEKEPVPDIADVNLVRNVR